MPDDFFEGVDQVSFDVDGASTSFPVFYRDARMFALVIPASLTKLRRMLPDSRFAPARVFPGVGGLILAALEYRDTDIGPYNELLVGVVLNSTHHAAVPGYNAYMQVRESLFNIFVHHLPVTSEIALNAGVEYYNFPKFLGDITFSDSPDMIACDLGRDGDRILMMNGEKLPTARLGEMKFMCNLYQYGQPQRAEFKINVVEGATSFMPSNVHWSFNSSNAMGRELSDAVVANVAVMYMYMTKIQCILYGPER